MLHRALQNDEMNLNHLREIGKSLSELLQECTMIITAHRIDEVETRHSGRRYAWVVDGMGTYTVTLQLREKGHWHWHWHEVANVSRPCLSDMRLKANLV